MKRKYKFCFLMIIVIVLSNFFSMEGLAEQVRLDFVIPQNIEPPSSYAEVTSRILAWQEIIPDGTIWNEHTPYGDEGYLGEYYEWILWDGARAKTTSCSAFAYLINNAVFGNKIPVTLNTEVTFDQIRPGDVLTINSYQHCVIVVQVYQDYIIVAEGNVKGKVRWNSRYSRDNIMSKIDYLETRYPDDFVDTSSTVATQMPSTTIIPAATPAPVLTTTPIPKSTSTPVYKYAKEQKVKKPYTYLYDSNNDKVDMFMLKSRSLTYKGQKISFKPIRWADYNQKGNIIVTQKNSIYYSVSYDGIIKVKKLGKGAIGREKKNGLVINMITKHGKKNVARK